MAQHIWLLKAANPSVLAMSNIVLSFCFDVFVVCVVLKRIFARDHSNSETIFGALCIYLLVGFGFASSFHLVSVLRPQRLLLRSSRQLPHRARSSRLYLLQLRDAYVSRRARHHAGFRTCPIVYDRRIHSRCPLSRRLGVPSDGRLPPRPQPLAPRFPPPLAFCFQFRQSFAFEGVYPLCFSKCAEMLENEPLAGGRETSMCKSLKIIWLLRGWFERARAFRMSRSVGRKYCGVGTEGLHRSLPERECDLRRSGAVC